jgi:hypothetical protein
MSVLAYSSKIMNLFDVDLKLGISEKSIFHEFHPDAEDLFNVTCDLKLVCEKLKDRGQRHIRQVHLPYRYLLYQLFISY